jgi:hypothetical protein
MYINIQYVICFLLLGKSVGLFKNVQVQEARRSADDIRADLKEQLTGLLDGPASKIH